MLACVGEIFESAISPRLHALCLGVLVGHIRYVFLQVSKGLRMSPRVGASEESSSSLLGR